MMLEVALKPDSTKPEWYSNDDLSHLAQEGFRWRIITRPHVWRPPTDVFETEEAIVVRVEIAGAKESEITILLQDRYLAIRGVRQDSPERRAYHQMEIPFGEFSTEVELSLAVDPNAVEAVYRDGFLRVVLPKGRPHHVRIQE